MGLYVSRLCTCLLVFFFQAEDGIRDLVRSRGLGDVYKRQLTRYPRFCSQPGSAEETGLPDASVDLIVAAQAFLSLIHI